MQNDTNNYSQSDSWLTARNSQADFWLTARNSQAGWIAAHNSQIVGFAFRRHATH